MRRKTNIQLLMAGAAVLAIITIAASAQNPSPGAFGGSGGRGGSGRGGGRGGSGRGGGANNDLGYTDTPLVPGQQWHVHDPARPHPPVVTPGAKPGDPPSDAIILFDGKDLSHWSPSSISPTSGVTLKPGPAPWKMENGYFEVVLGSGDIATKDKFGDVQLHVEFAEPAEIRGNSQNRGNSGIFMQGRYETQVLDGWDNPTYADGQIGAIYGQWPPLANPSRRPGEWQTYDIVFEAPKMNGDTVLKPAYVTVFLNGVLMHNHKEILGPTVHRQAAKYYAQPDEDSIDLQNHGTLVRYRNIWARKPGAYDTPEKK
jgi:hypothetical protein